MRRHSRTDRIAELILRIIADTIRQKLDDPRILPLTITRVKITRDLRLARVYYGLSGDARARADAQAGLEGAAGLFKKILDREMDLRYMPELTFHYDDTLDRAQRIEDLLAEIGPDHGPDDPDHP